MIVRKYSRFSLSCKQPSWIFDFEKNLYFWLRNMKNFIARTKLVNFNITQENLRNIWACACQLRDKPISRSLTKTFQFFRFRIFCFEKTQIVIRKMILIVKFLTGHFLVWCQNNFKNFLNLPETSQYNSRVI